jgi:drug/metabolite transporter (DMT)-like permease
MRMRVVLAFSAIFIIWGSTYLAIRYAVAEIPPLLTAGIRHLTAGSVLYIWARAKGHRATAAEWKNSAIVGALFFLVGHGTLHWAEQSVPSGLSALLVATEPLWIALLLAATGSAPLRLQTIAGVLLGLAGVWALLGMEATRGGGATRGTLAVLVGTASWGGGVVYSQRAALPKNAMLRTATTLLCGAVLLLATSTALGEYHQDRRFSGDGFRCAARGELVPKTIGHSVSGRGQSHAGSPGPNAAREPLTGDRRAGERQHHHFRASACSRACASDRHADRRRIVAEVAGRKSSLHDKDLTRVVSTRASNPWNVSLLTPAVPAPRKGAMESGN